MDIKDPLVNRGAETIISSVQNPRIKQWTELQSRKGREKQGRFLIEGTHLVQEALRSDLIPEVVAYSDERAEACADLLQEAAERGVELVQVTEAVLAKCTDTQTPQPVFAVVPKLPWRAADLISASEQDGLVVVIDGIQDPGNLGTIIRSADAVGASGVLLGKVRSIYTTRRRCAPPWDRCSICLLYRETWRNGCRKQPPAVSRWRPPGLRMRSVSTTMTSVAPHGL